MTCIPTYPGWLASHHTLIILLALLETTLTPKTFCNICIFATELIQVVFRNVILYFVLSIKMIYIIWKIHEIYLQKFYTLYLTSKQLQNSQYIWPPKIDSSHWVSFISTNENDRIVTIKWNIEVRSTSPITWKHLWNLQANYMIRIWDVKHLNVMWWTFLSP